MESVKNVQKNLCRDCQKEIKVENNGELLNGFELIYDVEGEKTRVFKCKECFAKDKSLRNYRSCEVYSRVVGYLRPLQQWNLGKQKEFEERKEYKV